jgi:hypothetical protein
MVNAFSFCIYGPPNPRYYPGLIQNVQLITKYYPSWYVFVYVGSDVSDELIIQLRAYPNVILRFTKIAGAGNMIRRFFAIDEPGVDLMMVRDADSRIHWKDRWAINEFLRNKYFMAHTIRDNIEHTSLMMGGLWGIRKTDMNIQKEYEDFMNNPVDCGVGHDQSFLIKRIYPKVLLRLLVHYSHERVFYQNEKGIKFPFEWTNDIYCGRIEDETFQDGPGPIQNSVKKFPWSL